MLVISSITLFLMGFGLGQFLQPRQEGREKSIQTFVLTTNTSVLGDLNGQSTDSNGSLSINDTAQTFIRKAYHSVDATSLILAMDYLRRLGSRQLVQVIDEVSPLAYDGSVHASVLRTGAAAILAEKDPQVLFELTQDSDYPMKMFVPLVFEQWSPPELDAFLDGHGESDAAEAILLGIVKRDPDVAWRHLLEHGAAGPRVWFALAQQWQDRGLAFLEERLAQLPSSWSKGPLLNAWGLQLVKESPQEALQLLEHFEVSDEIRRDYLSAILFSVAEQDVPAVLDHLERFEFENDNQKMGFATRIAHIDPGLTTSWAVEHLEGNHLTIFLERTLRELARTDSERAVSLLPMVDSPREWSNAMLGVLNVISQKDPIAAYEFWVEHATPQAPNPDLQRVDHLKSTRYAVARVDLDYAYQTLTTESSFRSEREWANAITYQLDRMSREESERWLASLPDAEWQRRLRWILEEQRNAPW